MPAEEGPHGGSLELCLLMRFLPAEHVVLDTLWLPTTLKECDTSEWSNATSTTHLKLCNPAIPKPTCAAVRTDTGPVGRWELQTAVSLKKCPISLSLRGWPGKSCLQNLTIKKTTHTIAHCLVSAQRPALGTQYFSNSASFWIPLCRSVDRKFYFKAAKCYVRDNGQKFP